MAKSTTEYDAGTKKSKQSSSGKTEYRRQQNMNNSTVCGPAQQTGSVKAEQL